MRVLKVGSLFSGIGAYEKACIKQNTQTDIKFYCDVNKTKSKAYSLLYGVPEYKNLNDVKQIKYSELDDIDILFYSPPCNSFSVAGNRKGIDDIRGMLFYDALKVIQAKQPKYCIMENVDNLPNKFNNIFDNMLKCLNDSGYYNYWKVINAKDFLPQNRSRVFVVSIKKDLINKEYEFKFPEGNNNSNWYDCINPSEGRELTGRQKRMIDFAKGLNKADKIKIEGEPQFDKSVIMLRQSGLRFLNNNHFPTIVAHFGTGGGNFPLMAYNGSIKGITPRQCFKLMGFDYEDSDLLTYNKISPSNQYIMAGDSVCVPILEGIMNEIIKIHNSKIDLVKCSNL